MLVKNSMLFFHFWSNTVVTGIQHACVYEVKDLMYVVWHCVIIIIREDNIPQLEDITRFLKKRTGFQLRPVAGTYIM